MKEETELVERPKLGKDEIDPTEKYSSSEVVTAAEEIKFTSKKKSEAIKNKQKSGKLSDKEAKKQLKEAYKTLAHTYNKIQLAQEYETNLDVGLTNEEYNQAVAKHGLNELTPPKHDPWWLKLFKSIFGGFFNVLLWFGSILCFIAYGVDPNDIPDPTNLYLGVVLSTVVTLTGIFGYYQEGKSADLMGSLSAMNKNSDVEVIRDGKPKIVEPKLLVPGDIINIGSGQAVPADIRLFECSPDMEVNNSSLTGESEPCKRDWRPEQDDIIPGEAANLMFFGTSIVNGKGKGVVVATGDNTFMGRTAALATSTDGEDTPIAKEIKDFVLKVSFIAFALGISFFIIGMEDNGDIVRNVIFLIGIIVANVPEGLLATVTVSLTLTARRMFDKNVRVKNLESVETLGSTSVICSDKTGTLTTSIMTCQHIYFDLEERLCDTAQPMNSIEGNFYKNGKSGNRKPDFLRLVRCGALCNNAEFIDDPNDPSQHGKVAPNANPTEAAMVKFSSGHVSAEYKFGVPKYRLQHKKLHEIPFNSKNKWQVSVHELKGNYVIGDDQKESEGNKALVQMKGAPERILNLCDRYFDNGEVKQLNEDIRGQIMDGVLALGSKGERVLALAELVLDNQEYDINIPEPTANIVEVEKGSSNKDAVMVRWNDSENMEVDINPKDDEGNPVNFDDAFVYHIKHAVANKVGIKYDAIRLFTSKDSTTPLAGDSTLKDVGITKGSVIYAYKGPYIFKGTKTEDVNWPFRRTLNSEEKKDEVEEGLIFLGLYAMIDPPRPGVPEAVGKCQSAGIKVIMVTGDHPVTAKAIAEQVGIIGPTAQTLEDVAKKKYGGNKTLVQENEYNAIVVPGWELQKVLDTEREDPQGVADFWNNTLTKPNVVFARTSPQQKLLIVSAVQERGGIVAVTGDGVNDSPALKKADIGVAMGITGTDVAKEAADMILLDDNFASIVNGVEEGRIIFDNLKKSIAYTLSSNIPEIAPFLIFQTVGIPLPLSTVMILLVDLGTDLAPAISMAYEGRESDIMKRPPRNPEIHKLVTWRLVSFAYLQIGMLQAIAGFYAYFCMMSSYGLFPKYLPNLDRDRAYGFIPNKATLRDAYWLWCFDGDSSNELFGPGDCIYTPEFEFSWQSQSFYDQVLFSKWLSNKDDYAVKGKDHIYKTCQKIGCSFSSSRNLLNGDVVSNKTLVWDCTTTSVSTDCISFKDVWTGSIEPLYRQNTGTNNLYENRRCEFQDYQQSYNEDLGRDPKSALQISLDKDKTPVICDAYTHTRKPRTYKSFPTGGNLGATGPGVGNVEPTTGVIGANNVTRSNAYSLYPMQTKTRTEALARSNSAYFISIIIVQWADLMICKTRIRSLFEQGMTNTFMNFSLFFETILGSFLVYVPVSNIVTGTRPIRFIFWAPAVPFSLMIYFYDEIRKGWIRKYKGGWIHRNTYW